MEEFIIRRFVTMLFVLLGVSLLTFGTLFVAPGDPAELILESRPGIDNPSEEVIQNFREKHGLNDPFPVQYGRWLWGVLHGDFGESYYGDTSVSALIMDRIPQTIELGVAAMFVALLIALPAGIISAVHKGQFPDYLSQIAALGGLSMPNFWLAYLLILVLAVRFPVFPLSGSGGLDHLVLPAVTMGTASAAILTRLLRASMLEVLNKEYVQTARSKGLPERIVVYKHALRNALIPIFTMVGLQFGYLVNGAFIAEVIFNRPGIGKLATEALLNRNFPVVMATTLLIAASFVLTNFFVDITYRYIDPRISLEGQER